MQTQMPEKNEGDGTLTALIAGLIGVPLTITIIGASSLKWYDFFWLIWVVLIVIIIILSLIYALISSWWEKLKNNTSSPAEYVNSINMNNGVVEKSNFKNSNTAKKKNLQNTSKLLKDLNSLIGLERVKEEVTTLINTVKINRLREEKGIKTSSMSMHLVFTGNPGTGKTTVARILAKIYSDLGVISKGHLVETDRAGMVGEFVGQTAIKTKNIIDKAKGGILFIDEAYALTPIKGSVDFGQEAVDTLLKEMEDKRDDLIVIVAGYPELMKRFLQSNPGLQSRFNTFINFEDYKPEELLKIFMTLCKENSFSVNPNAIDYLKIYFENIYNQRSETFANGRAVRNYFEKTIMRQANRLAKEKNPTKEDLQLFTIEDLFVEK